MTDGGEWLREIVARLEETAQVQREWARREWLRVSPRRFVSLPRRARRVWRTERNQVRR